MVRAAVAVAALLSAPPRARAAAPPAALAAAAGADGGVAVSVGGEEWLRSTAAPWVRWAGERRTLSLSGATNGSGSTRGLGEYAAQAWEWAGSPDMCGGGTVLRTELRRYASRPAAAVFAQAFPCGVPRIAERPGVALASAWPAFGEQRPGLSWATFNGGFAADVDRGTGLKGCKVGVQGGTPLMLYDESGELRTLVASQLTRVKTAEMDCAGGLELGLKGTLTSIPAGFAASWVLQGGTGITRTMEQWGDVLLAVGGKERVGMYQDDIVGSLGYWTDNGAYYHYPTSGPTTQAGGFQSEMVRVHQDHLSRRLPFRHWQLDSWWYLKGRGGNGSSRGQGAIGPLLGVYEWVADPFVFPDGGVPAVQAAVQLPFVLHNRWFGPGNWYKERGIGGAWTEAAGLGVLATLPLDGEAFWDAFFALQAGYGLRVYEQDFLFAQYDMLPALRRNATLADDWLAGMAYGAARHNLTIQYCMPYPRDYLASTQHRAVTTIRASDDYAPNNPQWRIARQSLLAHACGLLPFKDTFLSSDGKEDGAANPGPELTPELQTLVSALSGAMVGPGDGPGAANRSRLLQTCRDDGVLLKADRPAVPVDAAWTSRDPGGELSWAPSRAGGRAHRYVLAAALERGYNLTTGDVGLPPGGDWVAREWHSGALRPFNAATPLPLPPAPQGGADGAAPVAVPFEYWTIAEAVEGWVLLGEVAKYITASARRVTSVSAAAGELRVGVAGAAAERVELCALRYAAGAPPAAGALVCRSAVLSGDGVGAVTFPSAA